MKIDKEILAAYSEGDAKAFEVIYNRYHANIFFIVRKYIHSEEDAKDIRSTCFIKLWELREKLQFESMSALYSWIKRSAANACIDYLRKANTKECKKEEIISRYILDNEENVFEVSDKEAIIIERSLNRLEKLPDKFKVVFKMRCFDGLLFKDIAKHLNTDISTIKKRYSRSVKLLRDCKLIFLFACV